jgi:hypothetical protein
MSESAPGDDGLGEWIREHPAVWDYAWTENELADPDIDRIIDRLVAERSAPARQLRRRRRRIIVSACAAVAVTSGAVAAAAVLRSGQPTRPEAGTVCRAEPRLDSNAIVVEPGPDPVSGCLALWKDGSFAGHSTISGVPDLVACVDPRGAINVFPGDKDLCVRLHLEPADTGLSADNEAIVALQDRLTTDINLEDCQPVEQVLAEAKQILADSGLHGWRVAIGPGSEHADCAKTGVDASTRTITVSQF